VTSAVSRGEKLGLAAILIASAIFVGYDPGSYVFEMDPAELAEMGRSIAAGQELPLAGTNVAGGQAGRWLGPLFYYLVALPFFLSPSITFAALCFGGAFMLSVFLLWSSARALFGPTVAVTAAALFAASAQAIMELRLNFLTAAAPLVVLALLRACIAWGPEKRPKAVLWVAAFAGVLIQLHVVHVAYLGIVAVAYWTYRPKLSRRHLAIGVALAVALELPWVVEQIRTDGRDIDKLLSWLGSRGEGGGFDLVHGIGIIGTALITPFRLPLDALEAQDVAATIFDRATFALLAALTVLGIVLAPFERVRRPALGLLAAWLLGPLALFAIAQAGVYSFHMVSILPLFALIAALGAERITKRLDRGRVHVLLALVVALMVGQGAVLSRLASRADVQGFVRIPMSSVLSYPDRQWRFTVDVTFPTFRDADRLHFLIDEYVGGIVHLSGRVHGPLVMAFSHHPPYLPTTPAESDHRIRSGSMHYRLDRGEACANVDEPRARPWCMVEIETSNFYDGWEARLGDEGESHHIAFPARGEEDLHLTRELAAGTAYSLKIWTLGPTATGMDRPTPPELEVSIDGVKLEPESVRVDVPFWVLSESVYTVRTEAPARIEIRTRSTARYDVDFVWEEADP